jgi:protein-disulfide isomerase
VNQQGKYVAFHRAPYELRGPLDESKIVEVAKAVGLDMDRKLDVLAKMSTDVRRLQVSLEAQTLGISGTPGFAVGDKVFSGATNLKWLQAMIAEARRPSVTRRGRVSISPAQTSQYPDVVNGGRFYACTN